MKFIKQSSLSISEKTKLFKLWNNEYPEKLAHSTREEFDEYLNKLTGQAHILLIDSNKTIKGWYFDFDRDNEKWFAIIVDSNSHGKGLELSYLSLQNKKKTN